MNSRLLHEARREVEQQRSAARLDINPVDAMQEVLDGHVAKLRTAQAQVELLAEDELWRDTMVGRIPNEWIRLRDDYHEHLARFVTRCVDLGLAERSVRVQEAQTLLVAQEVMAAAQEAGLTAAQVRLLGAALRRRAQAAEAGVPIEQIKPPVRPEIPRPAGGD